MGKGMKAGKKPKNRPAGGGKDMQKQLRQLQAMQAEMEQKQAQPTTKRLYRPRINRSIAGVCSGLAAYFEIDPTLLRLITVMLFIFGGLSLWVYVILWIVIPEEPIHEFNINK